MFSQCPQCLSDDGTLLQDSLAIHACCNCGKLYRPAENPIDVVAVRAGKLELVGRFITLSMSKTYAQQTAATGVTRVLVSQWEPISKQFQTLAAY